MSSKLRAAYVAHSAAAVGWLYAECCACGDVLGLVVCGRGGVCGRGDALYGASIALLGAYIACRDDEIQRVKSSYGGYPHKYKTDETIQRTTIKEGAGRADVRQHRPYLR